MPELISAADEAYRHPIANDDPHWQERCYHLLVCDDGLMLDMGRAVWPRAGVRRAFAGACDGRRQVVVRVEEPLRAGADPDEPAVDDVVVEAVAPLREVRLGLGRPGDPLHVDLRYRARFDPVATSPQRVRQDGRTVTDYRNFFQSGVYDGIVELDGVRRTVTARRGFRDRGWGLRKHEGAPRRGLVLAGFCELPEEALYLVLFETASGRRALSDGWRIDSAGVDPVVAIEHSLTFSELLLTGGTIALQRASGSGRELRVTPRARLYLAGVGYSPDPRFRAPGREAFDVRDAAVREQLRGQTDHGCAFDVGGVAGYGYVETGLGIHARYRPPEGG